MRRNIVNRFLCVLIGVVTGLGLVSAGNASATTSPNGRRTGSAPAQCRAGSSPGQEVCVQRRADRAFTDIDRRAGILGENVGPPACKFVDGADYQTDPTRFITCSDTAFEVYTKITNPNGVVKITGSITIENLQWAEFSAESLTWGQGAHIAIRGKAWGTLSDGIQLTVNTLCRTERSQCSSTPIANTPPEGQLVTLGTNGVYDEEFTVTDTTSDPATKPDVELRRDDLGIRFAGPGSKDYPAWSYDDDYLIGRCDSRTTQTGNVNRGCVNPVFIPTLTLPISESGSSAAMVAWAQSKLKGHYGKPEYGSPLHYRKPDSTTRGKMCNSFTPDEEMNSALALYNDKDSCDEYPFFGSYENPAVPKSTNGSISDGNECAQLTAVQQPEQSGNEALDWRSVVPLDSPTGIELCVRAHIPSKLNSTAGGSFGRLVSGSRLVDKDPFWVVVTGQAFATKSTTQGSGR